MLILPAAPEIFLPAQTVLFHPAPALAHAFGQDHIHPGNRMPDTLYIFDLLHAQFPKQGMEIHLVDHTFDVGHANLKGMVITLFVAVGVQKAGQFGRDQTLTVELFHVDIHGFLHTGILADRLVAAVILDGDDGNPVHDTVRIIYDDDVIRVHVKKPLIDRPAAGEHESVVGVELGELAAANLHAQGHALPHGIIEIGADEGELVIPAHAGRTLEGHEPDGTPVEDKLDPLWAKEKLSHLLQLLHLSDRPPVEDPGEVEIDQKALQLFLVREPGLARDICQRQKLVEHGAIILQCLCDRALIGLIVGVEIKAPAVLCLLCEIQNRPRGNLKDAVLRQFHRYSLPSGWFSFLNNCSHFLSLGAHAFSIDF